MTMKDAIFEILIKGFNNLLSQLAVFTFHQFNFSVITTSLLRKMDLITVNAISFDTSKISMSF